MSEKKTYEIYIDIDNEGYKKFVMLNPYTDMCHASDNILHFYDMVFNVRTEDNGKSNFEFRDGMDLLFIELTHVEMYAFNLLNDWTPDKEG